MKEDIISRYCRGSVWFVCDSQYTKTIGSEQAKDRPWLIISCEENNASSPVINCVPISSSNGKLPRNYQVGFHYNGRDQIIHCESIMSKSIERFQLTGSNYMYKLPDSMMKKVDACIKKCLGLDNDLDYMLSEVSKMIDDLITQKQSQLTYLRDNPMVTDTFLSSVASKVKNLVDNIPEPLEVAPIKETKIQDFDKNFDTERTETTIQSTQSGQQFGSTTITPTIQKTKSGRNRWDVKSVKEFLTMMKTHSAAEVAKAYNLKDSRTAIVLKSNLLKRYGDLIEESNS